MTNNETWTAIENMLLIEAVSKLGDSSWDTIVQILSNHPLLKLSSLQFTKEACLRQYNALLNVYLERSTPNVHDGSELVSLMVENLRHESIAILEQQLRQDELRCRRLKKEIQDLKGGKLDEDLKNELEKKNYSKLNIKESDGKSTVVHDTENISSLQKESLMDLDNSQSEKHTDSALLEEDQNTLDSVNVVLHPMDVDSNSSPNRLVNDRDNDVNEEETAEKEKLSYVTMEDSNIGSSILISSIDEKSDSLVSNDNSSHFNITSVTASKVDPTLKENNAEENINNTTNTDIDMSISGSEKESQLTENISNNDIRITKEVVSDSFSREEKEIAEAMTSLPQGLPEVSSVEALTNEERIDSCSLHEEETFDKKEEKQEETEEKATTTHYFEEKIKDMEVDDSRRGDISEISKDSSLTSTSGESQSREDKAAANDIDIDQNSLTKLQRRENKNWKKLILMIWNDIANHRYGPMFIHPVKEEKAPGYYNIIKRPMDLNKVKQRVRDGVINNTEEFHRDVLLVFHNALMYNKPNSEIYKFALEMREAVNQMLKTFQTSESFANRGESQKLPYTRRQSALSDEIDQISALAKAEALSKTGDDEIRNSKRRKTTA